MSNVSDCVGSGYYGADALNLNDDHFNFDNERACPRSRGPNDPGVGMTSRKIRDQVTRAMFHTSQSGLRKSSPKLSSCLLARQLALSMGISKRGVVASYNGGQPEIFYRDIAELCRTSPFIDEAIREAIADAFCQAPSNLEEFDPTEASFQAGQKLVILPAA